MPRSDGSAVPDRRIGDPWIDNLYMIAVQRLRKLTFLTQTSQMMARITQNLDDP